MNFCPRADDGSLDKMKFRAKTPHFFKIILEHTIRDGKLWIPKKFASNYGDGMPSSVLLKVPSGAEWKVELKNCDGEVWMQNGWKEFAHHYSLRYGDLVVFRYEGNGLFHVVIFDMTTSEIEYPHTCSHGKDNNFRAEFQGPKIEEAEDDNSVEILGNISRSRKTREKSPLPCTRPHKMMRTYPSMRLSTDQRCLKSNVYQRVRPLSPNEKARAFHRACAFKSENPFFKVVMQPSYVATARKDLNIPFKFAKKHFRESQGDVTLRVVDGRTWDVKYRAEVYNGSPKASFYRGWKVFAMDNKLEVHDVCVFELFKGTRNSLNVFIFRANEDSNCRISIANGSGANQVKLNKILEPKTESGSTGNVNAGITSFSVQFTSQEYEVPKEKIKVEPYEFKELRSKRSVQDTRRHSCSSTSHALEARKFVSKYPFFQAVVRPSHFKCRILHVPVCFFEKYMNKVGNCVTLHSAGGSWPVKFLSYRRQHIFSAGWYAFARENSLKAGDICIFELIKTCDAVLKVSIFRCAG